jgi:hypothetical protein
MNFPALSDGTDHTTTLCIADADLMTLADRDAEPASTPSSFRRLWPFILTPLAASALRAQRLATPTGILLVTTCIAALRLAFSSYYADAWLMAHACSPYRAMREIPRF